MAMEPSIGSLRWPVVIAARRNEPLDAGGLNDEFVDVLKVQADIRPLGPMTFRLGVQTDTPATHRIWIRWLDWVDTNHVIIRRTKRPDGTTRSELFRIRRYSEYEGRKRFLEIEAEQEERQ